MPKLQRYVQKINKYKEKLKKIISRIGISYSEDFELKDDELKKLLLPCHLGVLFYGDFKINLFEKIKSYLNQIFDSFFFDIRNLGEFNFSIELFSKGVKKEYKEMKKSLDLIKMHPTNKFYQILIDQRDENNLGMIIALTDLPIYSSSDDNIIFLFGETHLKHRCCIISSLKLKEQFYDKSDDNELFEARIIKEIIHEIGHLILGSEHCHNSSCVMRFSTTVKEIDNKDFYFCNICTTKLTRIREVSNF
jgi:archaemetzincin